MKYLLVALTVISAASAAGILESLLSWEGATAVGGYRAKSGNAVGATTTTTTLDSLPQGKCLCQTYSCVCCVDLNLTASIDLGGPACVNVQQKDQNVTLNLNYADNPIHNATIKIEDAAGKPTCMNLLSDLAQICAKFVSMKQASGENQGHDGCLVIEPALLGAPQATYHMGCFNFNNNVRQIANPVIEIQSTQEASEEEDESLNADELIAAVSASAEQGIALFSQWLGLNLDSKPAAAPVETSAVPQATDNVAENLGQAVPVKPEKISSRSSRNLLLDDVEQRKSEERFKQLLSAQDKVLKGSDTIDQQNGLPTTFLYSQPSKTEQQQQQLGLDAQKTGDIEGGVGPQTVTISQENLAVVPRESRRGGRAYDIHRHVNEV